MEVRILNSCKKELEELPDDIIEGFIDAIAKLQIGLTLKMPLSRQMLSIGKQVFELRFRDKHRIYRVVYFIRKKEAIYIIHAFTKKTQKTPKKNIELAKKRLKRLL